MASCLDVCKKDSNPVVQQRIVKSMVGTCAFNTLGGDGPIANELLSFLAQLDDVSMNILEGCANEFFNKLYPGCSVQFHPKPNGIQFGRIAHVTTCDGMRKFFIKTHRLGHGEPKKVSQKRIAKIEERVKEPRERNIKQQVPGLTDKN